ncbi:YrhC family protein [Cytobacillus sp. Hm23]
MDEKQLRDLKFKIVDFTRIAFVLIAISVFLYLGVIINQHVQEATNVNLLMAMTYIFLLVAFLLFNTVIKYKKIVNDLE